MTQRRQIWWEILALPTWYWVVTFPVAILGTLTLFRDELLAPATAEKYRLPNLLPDISWHWWIVILLVLVLAILMESTYRAITRRDGTITELTNTLTPKLQLSFNPREGIDQTPVRVTQQDPGAVIATVREYMATFVRIRVDALSKTTVRECRAFLVRLEKIRETDNAFIPITLPHSLSLRDAPFDVLPEVTCVVDFLSCSASNNKLVLTGQSPLTLRDVFDDIATYRFTIAVNADDITEQIRVDIQWSGRWDKITGCQVIDPSARLPESMPPT